MPLRNIGVYGPGLWMTMGRIAPCLQLRSIQAIKILFAARVVFGAIMDFIIQRMRGITAGTTCGIFGCRDNKLHFQRQQLCPHKITSPVNDNMNMRLLAGMAHGHKRRGFFAAILRLWRVHKGGILGAGFIRFKKLLHPAHNAPPCGPPSESRLRASGYATVSGCCKRRDSASSSQPA